MTSLLDIWISQKDFYLSKTIDQIISIAGDGNLRDGSETSNQLRELLANIPLANIEKYLDECLTNSFPQGGFVLQDLVNESGRRLGFNVEPGYYRGGSNRIGFDGIWRAKDGYSFVVEVKTTDAYQINLDTLAKYQQSLASEGRISEESSSILLVVGRKDTGGLEAQTRGSRHAWDIRIISTDALLKLMRVRENLTDSATVLQIQEILKPLEYTRVDRLIDVIFQTSEDLQLEDIEEVSVELADDSPIQLLRQSPPAKYHDKCITIVSIQLGIPLIRQGRATYSNSDQTTRVLCVVSKAYQRPGVIRYWYAFHPSQQEFLSESSDSYVAFGCGSPENVILMPSKDFLEHLPRFRTTESNNRFYWHVEIFQKDDTFFLFKPGKEGIEITEYLIHQQP